LSIALAGLVLAAAGFAYDLAFAGIPYQDPTAEMAARYAFHSAVAERIMSAGALVFVVGLVAAPVIFARLGKR
jgi:hypothetical protein